MKYVPLHFELLFIALVKTYSTKKNFALCAFYNLTSGYSQFIYAITLVMENCRNGTTQLEGVKSSLVLEAFIFVTVTLTSYLVVELISMFGCLIIYTSGNVNYNLLMYGAETYLRNCQLCSHSRNSQHF
jgi:hypothetical protein